MQDVEFIIFAIAILIMSAVVHEVSHGVMANKLGDPTAKNLGRLTLNPIKHLDPVGTVLLPALLALAQSPLIFGWAKPVPYNPYNLSDPKWGELKVALAGPGSNIIIALAFALLVRFSGAIGLPDAFVAISSVVVLINIVLAIFNMIPIPPLDGSKVFFGLLPYKYDHIRVFMERYSLVLVGVLFFLLLTTNIFQVLVSYCLFFFVGPTGVQSLSSIF